MKRIVLISLIMLLTLVSCVTTTPETVKTMSDEFLCEMLGSKWITTSKERSVMQTELRSRQVRCGYEGQVQYVQKIEAQPTPVTPDPPSSGSCFFVDKYGTAVTNNHVIDGYRNIEVISANGSKSSATIIKSSNSLDLAVLATGHQTSNFLTLAPNSSLALGLDVFTIGYPVADILGDKPKYTEGSISALSGLNNDDSWIQVSTPIQPGNSGGPLVDEHGQVVGIVTATAAVERFFSVTGSLPQNINWAIKTEYARALIPEASTKIRFSNKQEAIAHTEKSICRVVAR